MIVIEQGKRLSESALWTLQRRYFEQQGIKAWRDGIVPHYITSNTFIARAYARVVYGYLRDCLAEHMLDVARPVYLVELGAGSGRFAYHFLRRFQKLLAKSTLKDLPWVYVMTDFTDNTIAYWQQHPFLKPLAEVGQLDFAHFDAAYPSDLVLKHAGIALSAEKLLNPLVLLANYVFDSIPQDCFTFEHGQIFDSLVTLSVPHLGKGNDDPAILKDLALSYEQRPITNGYAAEPDLNCIVDSYRQRLSGTSILFPNVALRCLRYFYTLAKGHLLLLSGDKGYSHEADLLEREPPSMAVHGSFSLLVNYHAIGEFVRNKGGQFLEAPFRHASLNVTASLFGAADSAFAETKEAFEEAIVQCGPDDFFSLKKGLEPHYADLTLEQILALLRFSVYDSNIFMGCFPTLLEQIETATPMQRVDLFQAIADIWEIYFPIGEEKDLPFNLAMLLYGLDYYAEALHYFEISMQFAGPDPSTLYNMAVCHFALGQMKEARLCTIKTLRLDPAFEPAKSLKLKFEAQHNP